ncbi:hypothetical protein CGLAUT_01385 [Corynebacterium glaucum]|uniref:hypothetical protein n=1 Tax=Corynebacterium glaucum TaxID=187491 RepID=UPI0025B5FBA7|nr:hypothetical protein [Corynebacterium glaucum]WJZ06787.1 hypothetical protein CGLAUT_01385 [Corynebacterium glaucum]
MAGMFPTLVSDPNDRNRRFIGTVDDTWPQPLRMSYWLYLVAAVFMLVTGMLMIAAGVPGGLSAEALHFFRTNMYLVAVGNMVLAVCITAAASFLQQGSKRARRVLSVCVGLAMFLNFAGFFVKVSSWAGFVIVFVLAFAVFFMFRPASNAFIAERSGDPWLGLK